MSPRTPVILLFVALSLGAFLYFYEIRGEEGRRAEGREADQIFPGLAAEDVERISLVTGDGVEAEFERREEGWRLVAPVDAAGDEITLDGMASTLAQLSREAEVQDPQPLTVYGLDEFGDEVRFRAAGQDHVLRLGIETPVGANAYVTREGSSEVSILPSWRVNSFRRDLHELRDARIVSFDRASVEKIGVTWPDGGVVLAERDGRWRVVEPVEELADAKTVDDLLSDLSFLRAEGFVDDPGPDDAHGLAPPEVSVELTLAGETGPQSVSVAFGGIQEGGRRIVRSEEPSLYLVAAERLGDVPRRLIDYRFKELASFAIEAARRVEIAYSAHGGGEEGMVVVELTDEGWRLDETPLATESWEPLVAEVAELKAVEILADSMGAAELAMVGLEPAWVSLRVFGVGGGTEEEDSVPDLSQSVPLAAVDLGVMDMERGIIARTVDRDVVYRVAPSLAEWIPLTLELFRERFPPIDPAEPVPEAAAGAEAPAASMR